ncbi:myb family transcription factor EFM-like [Cryptomeria japonica]|uniref:myb family transcription factor EFM-like n=1 Tax=Cryptomeria japonica TaxID=3369 RepID=UPI0027DA6A3A|nr:myb family transcription factor EFM-like [Cryptomeria japonica]
MRGGRRWSFCMTDLCKTMGSPTELTLDCRPSPGKYSSALKAISPVSDQFERIRQLDDYLKGLEEERKKIEAFKRELPVCMNLLDDAIAASKEQLANCQYMPASSDSRPVLEEFIPLKKPCDESGEESEVNHSHHDSKRTKFDTGEKPNWMSSVQLWSQNSESEECKEEQRVSPQENPLKPHDSHSGQSGQEQIFASNSKLFPDSKKRTGGGFLPFLRERQSNPAVSVRSDAGKTLPDLALSSGEQEVGSSHRCNEIAKLNNATTTTFRNSKSKEPIETAAPVFSKKGSEKPSVGGCSPAPTTSNGAQSQRKARMCWSPELHRRFVSALQQLGGSQVATPKQIRGLMKVDGLTNDEVKSHLQKYRLYIKRPSPSPQTSASQAPQLVVLGGIWVPHDYAAAHQAPGFYSPLSNTSTSHFQSH